MTSSRGGGGRLDLTVEALVPKPKYGSIFSREERRIAAHRLAEAGYDPRRQETLPRSCCTNGRSSGEVVNAVRRDDQQQVNLR